MKSTLSKPKAITLIALVITIVIIIILAGITINLSIGENGIFRKAKVAREQYLNAQVSEEKGINELYAQIFVANDGTITINAQELQRIIDARIAENQSVTSSVPAGTVISYMNDNAPTGYLACNGQAVSRTEYAELFTAIGTKYGAGDGSTTFNVPDLRGEFLRGTGTNSHTNQGNGTNVGTHQDATEHFTISSYRDTNVKGNFGIYTGVANVGESKNMDASVGTAQTKLYSGNFTAESTGEKRSSTYTSRPTNTSVLYCIKY